MCTGVCRGVCSRKDREHPKWNSLSLTQWCHNLPVSLLEISNISHLLALEIPDLPGCQVGASLSCVIIPCHGFLLFSVCLFSSSLGLPFFLPVCSGSFLRCSCRFLNSRWLWILCQVHFSWNTILICCSSLLLIHASEIPYCLWKTGWFSRPSNLFYFPCHCLPSYWTLSKWN